MGKSTLLATFLDTCGSAAELWVRCDEFEAEVAFATVALLADDPNPTRSEVEAGRRLLARSSDLQSSTSGVTVLAVDDAQSMDRSSANALRFALSRWTVRSFLFLQSEGSALSLHLGYPSPHHDRGSAQRRLRSYAGGGPSRPGPADAG